ncbi:MAG TPA: DUF952 domain-containing protein [Alphaproteobacteria bacterium]|nr:DUF952 domain-containing protein [Alphaproteobacteria bacterium]
MAERTIFKIFRAREWQEFAESGEFSGSPDDRRDGFIHFSYADQVPDTLANHFAHEETIVLAAFDEAAFGASLKAERSRGGAQFPHVYGVITKDGLRAWARLQRGHRGFALPDWCGGEA